MARWRGRIGSGAVAAGIVLAAAVVVPAVAAAEPALPVPYGVVPAALGGGLALDGDPPGANDWSCEPSAAHPDPVVLVHGFTASKSTNWPTISPLLANEGYCVFALTYGEVVPGSGGFTAMESSAEELAAFVDDVRAATGAERVDLVGHSEGTLMPQYYLQFLGGEQEVDDFVAVTPLYDGTLADPLPVAALVDAFGVRDPLGTVTGVVCEVCPQFIAGSDYLERMNAAGPAVPGVTYTTVLTRYDELVIPYTSGLLDAPNATNIVVQDGCEIDLSDHVSIIFTARTGQIVLNALDPANAVEPPCRVSLPALGNEVLPVP